MKEVMINVGPWTATASKQFKRQRALLSTLMELTESKLTARQYEDLIGLQNLCDHLADQLHDVHGFKTLFGRT